MGKTTFHWLLIGLIWSVRTLTAEAGTTSVRIDAPQGSPVLEHLISELNAAGYTTEIGPSSRAHLPDGSGSHTAIMVIAEGGRQITIITRKKQERVTTKTANHPSLIALKAVETLRALLMETRRPAKVTPPQTASSPKPAKRPSFSDHRLNLALQPAFTYSVGGWSPTLCGAGVPLLPVASRYCQRYLHRPY